MFARRWSGGCLIAAVSRLRTCRRQCVSRRGKQTMTMSPSRTFRRLAVYAAAVVAAATLALQLAGITAQATNPIPAENQLPGNPRSEWDITGSGDSTIQGFATDISVNKGGTISFKVTTTAAAFSMNIYRLG